MGIDNVFGGDRYRWTLRLIATTLTKAASLCNFLSTFSGAHFVAPRSYQAEFGVVF